MIQHEPISPPESQPMYEYLAVLGGRTFRYRLRWMDRPESWYLTLWDSQEQLLLDGQRVQVDWAPLWRFAGEEWPPGLLMLIDTEDLGEECSYEDMGRRCQLIYADAEELVGDEDLGIRIDQVA